ncbi:D-alanyl-D-alanine carboxypeptidase/D-alanyl-D-alanine-endopeptidase [Pseudooceanicola marinus]|uniref:D-alanyl-D-alanine carboxypeptidase/D-alanyl-D-alanine endopeptidase n=1 Tax=Pseudooceanicola marinus TaxID=396013 RepID=UPI001CD2DB39|nr:D-alanyl-D-alanine carboxypeptidase/D-alanyl-D-alanine-endopeptidase [Pseudooceanicola marinus]MCA1338268.1 D-alanyl-D-alanine carboxypeptidase/D-alanyl-D-alanine-endopeptidase [Pseudooceanicola marinus]
MTSLSRRALLGAMLSSFALPLQASAPATSLRPRLRPDGVDEPPTVQDLVDAAGVSGVSSLAVARLGSSEPLESAAADAPLPPASVGKTLTALYALAVLGPQHRFATRVLGTGTLANGRLDGDLILVGGGDPGLDTTNLADLAGELKAAGLREVRGRFLYYGGALPEARLIDADQPDHVGYNPGVSALSLNYNRVHFEWKRQAGKWAVTMDARTRDYRPDVTIARMQVVDRSAPVYTYADRQGRDDWTVAQGALGNGGARWLPVRRPAAYAAEVFATMARANGIVLDTPEETRSLPAASELARHESRPLVEIAKLMLYYSNNLTAELLGLSASAARGGKPASIRASAQAMSDWARATHGLRDVAMVDHSGLGDASRFPAADLVRMLADRQVHATLKPLLKDIDVRDDQGRPMSAPGFEVAAKTGTLNFVSGLAGYVVRPDGDDLAFAVVSGDLPRRASLSRAERERPRGGRAWTARARGLQQDCLKRWGALKAQG